EGFALARMGPAALALVRVDFSSPRLLHRLRGIGPRREDIARAVGLPATRTLHVLDATAGWGGDSVVLAALGCEITMIERSPVLFALLADGLARLLRNEAPLAAALHARMRLLGGDARALLRAWEGEAPDVVLLDPMYPERGASAAARKEMALLQELLGGDADADELLEPALALARHRVVVKRPRAASPLAGRAPSHRIEGRSTRFDVYALKRMP
ncbi:MAG: class I SAM-dependent methyltransferase, partial [Gammaproteobacteria bacterium]